MNENIRLKKRVEAMDAIKEGKSFKCPTCNQIVKVKK